MAQEQNKGKSEIVSLSDAEFQQRAEQEGVTRAERIANLEGYAEKLFSGEEFAELRTQIRESFDVPQWGEYHNEGLLMDTHLDLITKRIEAICGDASTSEAALHGVDAAVAERIKRAVTSEREDMLRYALLHDVEKRNTMTFNKKNEKGKREMQAVSWESWRKMLTEHPDPVSLRTYFLSLQIDSIGYKDHGEKGAEALSGFHVAPRIVKGIQFHELGFQSDVKTKTIRERGSVDPANIDFIVAVNFLDQSSSLRKDGAGDTTAMRRVERMLSNIGVMQAVEEIHVHADTSSCDAEDLAKAIQELGTRSDAGERLASPDDEWKKLFETHRLRMVDGEALARTMEAVCMKKNLVSMQETISAVCSAVADPARCIQPEKVAFKLIYQTVADKKLAGQMKVVFQEALLEARSG